MRAPPNPGDIAERHRCGDAGGNADDFSDQALIRGFDFDTSADFKDAKAIFKLDRKVGDTRHCARKGKRPEAPQRRPRLGARKPRL
jgi:hypothetical protein